MLGGIDFTFPMILIFDFEIGSTVWYFCQFLSFYY
jgi:hypothetical protein